MSSPTTPGSPTPNPAEGQDPSMEDILASIRRILSEEEPAPEPASSAVPAAASPAAPAEPPADDVLDLDASMMIPDPAAAHPEMAEAPPIRTAPPPPVVAAPAPSVSPLPSPVAPAVVHQPEDGLMERATTEVAASSIVNLVRTIASERATQVHRGGPTIEDLVREEIRPALKLWLDTNLPPLVERLVQAEIQRVVGRALS